MKRIFIAVLLGGWLCPVQSQPKASASEYELKAAFLINFASFVEWPRTSGQDGRFVIGIVGSDPFGSTLEQSVSRRTIRGLKPEVKRFASYKEIEDCDVLFLSSLEDDNVDLVLTTLQGRPVLTVGESLRFHELGGMITFINDGSRIRFQANPTAARRAGLTISSKLLNLAWTK